MTTEQERKVERAVRTGLVCPLLVSRGHWVRMEGQAFARGFLFGVTAGSLVASAAYFLMGGR